MRSARATVSTPSARRPGRAWNCGSRRAEARPEVARRSAQDRRRVAASKASAQPAEAEQVTAASLVPSPLMVDHRQPDGSITVGTSRLSPPLLETVGTAAVMQSAHELAHALLKSQLAQPVREDELGSVRCSLRGRVWGGVLPQQPGETLATKRKAELMRVVSIVERHHGPRATEPIQQEPNQ